MRVIMESGNRNCVEPRRVAGSALDVNQREYFKRRFDCCVFQRLQWRSVYFSVLPPGIVPLMGSTGDYASLRYRPFILEK